MLTVGTRLGPYEVTAKIGVGGMGEVYQATDTNLKRQVAIKVLPAAVAGDADRLARFQREAEVLAALNHPNIAAIYGLEKTADFTALVMELVEGDDLSQRIARGAIPIDEALPIAKQIADALEAAHEQGIIHRDLKPANIKVRADGMVKVLDFGLAKAMEPTGGSSPSLSMSPTLTTPAMTQAGTILGTAAYMSPEQAKGRTVDKRSDVWAFGAVMFEMLTGTRAFDGDGISETLARVIEREPAWNRLPARLSPALRTYLERCLQKDPRQRIRDIGDMRLALDGAFETVTPQTTAAATSLAPRGRLARMTALAAVAVLGIVALSVPALRHLRETAPPAPPETRVDIVTAATDDPASFALSPDGRQIVSVASGDGARRMWLRSLATTTAHELPDTEGAQFPFWSPDSRSVGFFADGKLKRFDLGGSAPRTIATVNGPRGGTWNADGVILFTPNSTSPLFRVRASGGETAAVTTLDRQSSHRFPPFLPDGRHFLFYATGTPDTAGIYLGALDAPGAHRLTAADAASVFLSPGWLLWVRAGTLVAQRLDVDRHALAGDPVVLADRVAIEPAPGVAAVSASAGGLVAYRTGAGRRQLACVDRSGTALGPFGAPDEYGLLNPSVPPDGRRAVVSRTAQGNTDIWLMDGTRTSRLTSDAAADSFPIWSPDGSRIVFESDRTGHADLYQKASSGAGAEDLLVASPQDKFATDWSADGRFLLNISIDPQTDRDLWVLPMEGGRTPWVFLKTPFDERNGQFSPDGRWVAYQSNESGRTEVYIRPFEGPPASGAGAGTARSVRHSDPIAGQWQVSTAGGVFPRWRRDGKELYYLAPNGTMMATLITVTGATVAPENPVALFRPRIVGGGANGAGREYDVSRDGRFLINTVLDDAAAPITLLQNWHPDVKR